MTFDEWMDAWDAKAAEKGHVLKRDEDGKVDHWVVDSGYHNGPGCAKCHASWCHHCTNMDNIEDCPIT